MTAQIIRYSLLGLALIMIGLFVNNARRAYLNGDLNSLTTELPAKEAQPVVEQKTPPVSSGKTIAHKSFIPTFISSALKNKKEYPVITLGKSNTLVFRDIVTQQSMGALELKLIEMSNTLPPSTPIYLVLETPGGDIDAGAQMIDLARGLPQEIKTITMFSASMGFHIVESLGERLITPSGTLMSHRAAIDGLAGHVPGEAVVRLNKILTQVTDMDKRVSKRVGLSLNDYQALVHDEYWVSGQDAVNDHMADKVVLISCAEDLSGSYTQNISTLFGTLSVEWSNCPAIGAPLSANSESILNKILDTEKRKEFSKFLNDLFNDKQQFIKNYIINETYKKFVN